MAATRRWFAFSLRTMFVLVTLVCIYLAWQMSNVRPRQAMLREVRGKPHVQITTADAWARHLAAGGWKGDKPAEISVVRRWLGDEAIQEIACGRGYHTLSPHQFERLQKLFPEAKVHEYEVLMEPCHPGCFPRGTLVQTPSGPRPIESIGIGDELTALKANLVGITARVESVFVTTNRLWKVEIDGGILLTTQPQPLWSLAGDSPVAAGGEAIETTGCAVCAGDLEPGDRVFCFAKGELRPVTVLDVSPTDRVEEVFNLVLGNSQLLIAGGFVVRSKPPAE